MARVTIKDVALRLGVAPGTVSRAINNKPGISANMRERITATAEEMGFTVNRMAQSLSSRPIIMGVLMPSMRPEYYRVVRRGIEKALDQHRDYRIQTVYRLIDHIFDEKELDVCVRDLIQAGSNVVLVTYLPCPGFRKAMEKLQRAGVGIFLIGDDLPEFDCVSCEKVDGTRAGMIAAEFANLIMHKSRKVAAFLGYQSQHEHKNKWEGFSEFLKEKAVTLIGAFETYDNHSIAMHLTYNLLESCPDAELIYVTTSNCVAVCKALDEMDPQMEVKVIATDIFEEMMPYVDNGRIVGIIYQNLESLGMQAVDHAFEYYFGGKKKLPGAMVCPILVMSATAREYL